MPDVPLLSEPSVPETFPGIVDAVPDAVVVVDASGAVRFANARAEVLFDSLRHELVGRPAGELVAGLCDAARAMLRSDGPDERIELTARRLSAGDLPVEVWLARIRQDGEEMVTVAIRDDSERRSLREASTRMRDDLFASVSHELRTPLTSIIGYTEILVDMGEHAVSAHATELLSVIERNATRELRLVEDLLMIASLDASALVFHATPIDLAEIVADAVARVRSSAADGGVEVRFSGADPVQVCGDRHRLKQVVRNLLCNAVKFTPRGGQVSVELVADGSSVGLVVDDQGVGVSADELPRLFEQLYRGSHAVDAHLRGVGLGLPIVKEIVDAHGGHIDLESRHGEGTRVAVRLPLADPSCC